MLFVKDPEEVASFWETGLGGSDAPREVDGVGGAEARISSLSWIAVLEDKSDPNERNEEERAG